jgi:tRNA nucleotidyltransferase (CCA-adding enzyme)
LIVGGYLRDKLLGLDTKDFDFEVQGLDLATLEATLSGFGEVITVGRSFGVLMLKGERVDFAVPRRDNKIGRGHADFRCEFDPHMSYADAARRRDLTINSMALDPLTGEILDPHGGQSDVRARRLRATDPASFTEDPLRAVRVAQFMARFEMQPDAELRQLCGRVSLNDISGERLWVEFNKLLLKSQRPSLGLEFLRSTELLSFFPGLHRMVEVPQDPIWHPEGSVWEHTLMVVDEAAQLRVGVESDDVPLMYGALLHDIGKPATTFTDAAGRVRSPNHESEGVAPAAEFLGRLRAPNVVVEQVSQLVRHHLAPATFPKQDASPKAYRRLARRLAEGGVTFALLLRLARADHLGRTTPDALAREFSAGDEFQRRIDQLDLERRVPKDVVRGRDLIARGMRPGRVMGLILERCRDVQDETDWQSAERILERVFAEKSLEQFEAEAAYSRAERRQRQSGPGISGA